MVRFWLRHQLRLKPAAQNFSDRSNCSLQNLDRLVNFFGCHCQGREKPKDVIADGIDDQTYRLLCTSSKVIFNPPC